MPSITNIGILAHVDAGKTSLTERILFESGAIPAFGSVDAGTTRTDTMDLERQRGITIRSAVASFTLDQHIFNLVDTPGHPDFIAEVERALGVLDAVILVVAAVEGIQPQTRRLFRVVQGLRLPCLLFVNKIDRPGARPDDIIRDLRRELDANPLPLSEACEIGTRDATSRPRSLASQVVADDVVEILGARDSALLDRWVEQDGKLDEATIMAAIRDQFRDGALHPVVFGSAITGAGLPQLLSLLPSLAPDATETSGDGAVSAGIFKVERTESGERAVICRIWQGALAVRDTVPIARPNAPDEISPGRITRLSTYRDGSEVTVPYARTGEIVRITGLADARIGDWLGTPLQSRVPAFEPPVFEYRVIPASADDRFHLNQALTTLADEDPLISVRFDEVDQAVYIHLYGEVQREVIDDTLRARFGLQVSFGEPTVLCVERLLGPGRAAEISGETDPPFYATVGFRIQPRTGAQSTWRYKPGKAKHNFFDAAEIGGRSALAQGPHGWPVIDIDVEVTDLIYLVMSVPSDYRKLATLVMADAVKDAGTVVCEPVHRFVARVPMDHSGSVIHLLSTNRADIESTSVSDDLAAIEGTIPAATIDAVTMTLPGLTNGRGDMDTRFYDYAPVPGDPPRRRRTDLNPYNRIEYLSRIKGRF